MIQADSHQSAKGRAAFIGTLLTFATLGFVVSSWLGRLPAIREILDLSPSAIGTTLFIGSLGSLFALPFVGRAVSRFGPRIIARTGVTTWAIGFTMVTLSVYFVTQYLLLSGLVIMSLGVSQWGTSMNVEGGYIEAVLKRPVLNKLHALFSIGTVLGAGGGAVLAHFSVPVVIHLAATTILGFVSVWVSTHFYVVDADLPGQSSNNQDVSELSAGQKTAMAWREKHTVFISIMVLSAGLMEGAANDWLALAMVDGYGFTEAAGSLSLAFFLLLMVAVRLTSGRLQLRWGVAPLLQRLLLCACVGLALVAFGGYWPVAMVGIVLWAMGSALIYPSASSSLSVDPRMTAARVSVLSTINYAAFLVGPPALGWIAEHLGYEKALAFLIPFVLIGLFFSQWLPDGRFGNRAQRSSWGDGDAEDVQRAQK